MKKSFRLVKQLTFSSRCLCNCGDSCADQDRVERSACLFSVWLPLSRRVQSIITSTNGNVVVVVVVDGRYIVACFVLCDLVWSGILLEFVTLESTRICLRSVLSCAVFDCMCVSVVQESTRECLRSTTTL